MRSRSHRRVGRRVALAALTMPAATMAAACSTEEAASTPSGPAPTASSTTSTVAATTTALPPPTTEATTTTAAPDTTAPPPPSTTPVAPPGDPTSSTVPVFVGADGGWLLLGSWSGTGWESATAADGTARDVVIPEGTAASLVSLAGGTSTSSFGAPTAVCADDRSGPTLADAVVPITPPRFGFGAVAVPGTADLQPRPVVTTSATPAGYPELLAGTLAGAGLPADRGSVVQLVVTDLDSDGADEVIAVFEYQADPATGTPGDFSTVVIVDAATRATTTLARTFVAAPDEPDDPDAPPPSAARLDQRRVVAVADLNADRRSEIVVQLWAGGDDPAEPTTGGAAAEAYTFDGTFGADSTDRVMTARC